MCAHCICGGGRCKACGAEAVKWIEDLEASLWRETQERERYQEDVDCTHKWLDDRGAPREEDAGTLSLVGRIMRLPSV